MNYLHFEHEKELRFGVRISLRSFFVDNALKQNKGIKVSHNGETMTLEPDDLRQKGHHNKNSTHTARYSSQGISAGKEYYLIDYNFTSDAKDKKAVVEQLQLI